MLTNSLYAEYCIILQDSKADVIVNTVALVGVFEVYFLEGYSRAED